MSVVWLKPDYNTKISELEKKLTDHNHGKYITTPEFNTLAADVFNARLAQANLITKTDFDAKLSSLNRKITANKSKNLLVENEFKKWKLLIRAILLARVTLWLLWYQKKSKIGWKLFKTTKHFIESLKSSKHLHRLWTWCF